MEIFVINDDNIISLLISQHLKNCNIVNSDSKIPINFKDDVIYLIYGDLYSEVNIKDKINIVYKNHIDKNNYSKVFNIPINMQEIIFYINNLIYQNNKILFQSDIKLYLNKNILEISGEKIELTEKEKELILFLQKKSKNGAEKSEILQEIWGYNSLIDTHTLSSHIYKLRKKIPMDLIYVHNEKYFLTLEIK